jgi:hypothetical protein
MQFKEQKNPARRAIVRFRTELLPVGARVTHQAADSRTWNLLPVALA